MMVHLVMLTMMITTMIQRTIIIGLKTVISEDSFTSYMVISDDSLIIYTIAAVISDDSEII